MALIDRIRDAWDDLRGTPKEEQETTSVRQSAGDPPSVAALPYETDSALRASHSSAFTELEQFVQTRTDGSKQPENEPLVVLREIERPSSAEASLPSQDRPRTILDDLYETQLRDDERNWRLEHAVSPGHEHEFHFVKETGDIDTYKHLPTGNHIHLDSKGDFYDVQEGKEPSLTTRAEILKAYQELPPEVAATLSADHREKWIPLEKELGFTGADDFSHHSTRGDIQVYMTEVNDRTRMVGLDNKGQFYDVSNDGAGEPISRDQALFHIGVRPSFYTPAEYNLREAVGNENTIDLVRNGKSGDIVSYEYTPTGGSIHLDSDGKFYNIDRQIISRDEAVSTMQVPTEGGREHIAAAPAQAPSGSAEHVGVPHANVSEMPLSQGTVQPAVQEQFISM